MEDPTYTELNAHYRDAVKHIGDMAKRIAELEAEAEKERADTKHMLDAYADENGRIAAERDRLRRWAGFGLEMFDSMRTDGGSDIDGGEAQSAAIAFGLLSEVVATEPCGDDCWCAQWDSFPQTCLRLAVARPTLRLKEAE